MKTFALGLTFLGFTILMQSQNEMASVDVNLNDYVKTSKVETYNLTSYDLTDNKIISERARKLQNIVANYDIKQASIYAPEDKSTYNIAFREGENQINAEYNQDGKIIECNQLFKDIKLPYAISSDIAKKYPGWKFSEVSCEVSYVENNEQEVIYKVAIENGNQRKTLKLNAADFNL